MNNPNFDVRAEIMTAISLTDDSKDRAMLMLMLGILERVEKLLDDEAGLQAKVLNGLTVRHKQDHEWIEHQRDLNCHEICKWANDRMVAEAEATIAKKGFWTAARTGFAAKLAELAVTVTAAVAAALWTLK